MIPISRSLLVWLCNLSTYVSPIAFAFFFEQIFGPGHRRLIRKSWQFFLVYFFFQTSMSERVYKKAWEFDRILELLREERGEHFDPELIDCFFENLDAIVEIRENFLD